MGHEQGRSTLFKCALIILPYFLSNSQAPIGGVLVINLWQSFGELHWYKFDVI